MKYDLKTLKKYNIYIHCKDYEDVCKVLDKLTDMGVTYMNREKPNDDTTKFIQYNNTCFYTSGGLGLTFCGLQSVKILGAKIITASEFLSDNTPLLYTEAEVLEIERKAFEAARERTFVNRPIHEGGGFNFNKYETFEDYLKAK